MRALAAVLAAALLGASAAPAGSGTDPFLWLEQASSPRALAWVRAENAKTLAVLQRDPHFATFDAEALKIGQSHDRIPAPAIIDGRVYNFWQDATHVRGIWRWTTVDDYARAAPAWTTALDLDALAAAQKKNWVWQGADCQSPSRTRCLIALSEGGADASTIREFDLTTSRFVDGGFSLPNGKQDVAWVDDDTILVAREWEPGELTASGYPYVVKRLTRGQSAADAVEIMRGVKADVSETPFAFIDGSGHRVLFVDEGVSFFESRRYLIAPSGPQPLAVPLKSDIEGLVDGRLLIYLREPWTTAGVTLPAGALASVDLAAAQADPAHLVPTLVYAPGPRESLVDVGTTRDHAVLTTLDNVRGRAAIFTPSAGGWTHASVRLPDNAAIDFVDADTYGSAAFVTVTDFLTPTKLMQIDTDAATAVAVKARTPQFDASKDVVEQRTARSNDGTIIPYFLVRPAAMKANGTTPTILNAYGGFQVSSTPYYSGVLGKLWLERGGAYALANIRGGGEFGPAWHDAGLTTHRQRIYDDFAAVGRDLIARKVTRPRRLGIVGGSNGGLLMGVELEQHPDLWNAVQIEVPLLDMLRYEQIAAGASWVGEYGSVSVPAQRAFLASISPYNNIKRGVRYPEPFIWTTTKDDRVGPAHARKFAAKLAAMHIPYLFYEVIEGGHAAGANIRESAFTTALGYTYFTQKLMP